MLNEDSVKRSDLIDFLLKPSAYPHNPDKVIHIQTHASDVFVVPPYVYKVKKPVDFGFLDFSTLEKRKLFCEKEIELNRRLCGETYIGVEEIKFKDGAFAFSGEGETVEYAVKMNKLPEEKFLINILGRGEATEENFTRLARKLRDFYSGQTTGTEVLDYGAPERIKVNIDEVLSISRTFTDTTLSPAQYNAISFYNGQFFANKTGLLLKRKDENYIKDCHGDLHLEHINFAPPEICIYDCIEFNERFRYIDIASDIAFLAMDLDYNGYYGFSGFFVSEIQKEMDDNTMGEVIDFYKCYRACVRGEVESIRGTEKEVPEEGKRLALSRAEKYFKLALRYALFGSPPVVIVTFGIIGTGKSTLAGKLGEELGANVISSDYIRKEITGMAAQEKKYEGYDKGIYSPDMTERTYRELLARGGEEIKKHNIVILDASFSKLKWRELLARDAWLERYEVYYFRTDAPEAVIRERLIKRELEGASVSDARVEIMDRFMREFEEPEELRDKSYFTVNTVGDEGGIIDSLFREIISRQFSTEAGE
ncbi:MAG: AAA family ATPase [Deltaproteobacteria bacterium]